MADRTQAIEGEGNAYLRPTVDASGNPPLPTPTDSLEGWLKAAFAAFDHQVATQPPEVVRKAVQVLDLRAPCQAFAFGMDSPRWQGFVFTHVANEPHGRVKVFDCLQQWQAGKAVEQAFKDALWDNPLPSTGDPDVSNSPNVTLRDVAFLTLDGLLNHLRASTYLEPPKAKERFWAGGSYGGNCILQYHRGPLEEWTPEAFVDQIFTEARQTADQEAERKAQIAASPPAEATPYVERKPPYHGTFILPELRIGHIKGSDIGDWYRERDHEFPGIVVAKTKLGPHPLLVTYNGFLALQTDDQAEAARWLNFAMAGVLSHGVRAGVVNVNEVGGVYPPNDGSPFWGGSYGSNRLRRRMWPWGSTWLDETDVASIVGHAERLANESFAVRIPVFLQALTHLADGASTESFVYSWALIEQEMTQRWDRFLQTRSVASKRKEKLQGSDWTLYTRSETLALAGVLDAPLLAQLDVVRKARNDVMHGDRLATPKEAEAALDLAESLMVGDAPRIRAPPRPSQAASLFETL